MVAFCLIIEKCVTLFVLKLLLKVVGGGLMYAIVLILTKNEIALEYIEMIRNK